MVKYFKFIFYLTMKVFIFCMYISIKKLVNFFFLWFFVSIVIVCYYIEVLLLLGDEV